MLRILLRFSIRSIPARNFALHRLLTTSILDNHVDHHTYLSSLRNVGVFAHVDAGKTTITENMLSLSGLISSPGKVDDGDTVTDFLQQERERGITIQSACITLPWKTSRVNLIDTPGHVDFTVEVSRSLAALDAAVLVVDAVEGVQAQTRTVWDAGLKGKPFVAVVNKLDRVGGDFKGAVDSVNAELCGSEGRSAVGVQVPVVRCEVTGKLVVSYPRPVDGEFLGVVDVVSWPMKAVLWEDSGGTAASMKGRRPPPSVYDLGEGDSLFEGANEARQGLVEAVADVDDDVVEYYLAEKDVPGGVLKRAVRRATVEGEIVPVFATAALKRRGVEPVLDAVCDYLPSPVEVEGPEIIVSDGKEGVGRRRRRRGGKKKDKNKDTGVDYPPGHPLCKSLVALAFKVVHVKGRGGGDGRVVFVRVFSGELEARKTLRAINAATLGSVSGKSGLERPASLLSLSGGRMTAVEGGVARAGEVCAIVGLKGVETGDTLVLNGDPATSGVCLAGVSAPRPVLTVKLDPRSSDDESKLDDALRILCVEDPSLKVSEAGEGLGAGSGVLLSGLGELHVEVVTDRLIREFGCDVKVGEPSVAVKEALAEGTVLGGEEIINFERDLGGNRMHASIALEVISTTESRSVDDMILPFQQGNEESEEDKERINKLEDLGTSIDGGYVKIKDNAIVLSDSVRSWLELRSSDDEDANTTSEEEEEVERENKCARAIIEGIKGALQRGPSGGHEMCNVRCKVLKVETVAGYGDDQAGALRAATSFITQKLLKSKKGSTVILEPQMTLTVNVDGDAIGSVLSDFSMRGGIVSEVMSVGEDKQCLMGKVPLRKILGYSTKLRSLTAGSGVFTAEYYAHRAT